ncbi:MAG TPA: lipoate--protein ligase family protein [Gemmata sp.]|nr:lipoate--protein ligase family protein [Gemmata sp.]
MRLLDLTLPSPAENLALDEALLIAAEEGSCGEVLRLWELSSQAVVVGAGGSVVIDVNVAACEADGIPILRRASGGGTVLLGPGCLCFSLVLAYDRAPGLDQIASSNQYVLGRILKALKTIAPNTAIEGTSDLAIARPHFPIRQRPHPPTPSPRGRGGANPLPLSLGERGLGGEGETLTGVGGESETQGFTLKISGNAQQRKRRYFLHHGTLLCGFDLEKIPKYLNSPERQPTYRQTRLHKDFLANLTSTSAELKALLVDEWQLIDEYSPVPWESVQKLVTEKYSRDDWNRRR